MSKDNNNEEKGKVNENGICSIGIDLGTTNSCVAYKGKVIPNAEGDNITPSVLAVAPDGRLIVGKSAQRQASVSPSSAVFAVKRHMGAVIEETGERYTVSLKKKGDNNEIIKLSPEQVSAEIITELVMYAESYLGQEVNGLVITVPAYFTNAQKKATSDAVEIASAGIKARKNKSGYNLELKRILNEPTSAALAYGLDKTDSDQTIIVYDLGGGTFDVSIIKISPSSSTDNEDEKFKMFEVLSVSGDNKLGGEDFDNVICELLLNKFEKVNKGINLRNDKLAMRRLRDEAKNAKHHLSSSNIVDIQVANISSNTNLDCSITREEFEKNDNVQRLLMSTKDKIIEALSKANLKSSDIDQVVLVGGSTRMPMVEKLVTAIFGGKKINKTVNPDEVVAIGASIQASILAGDIKNVVLLDVIPLSLGIETYGGVMTVLLQSNSTKPTKSSKIFSTFMDYQQTVQIKVYEGERPRAEDNKLLGVFELEGIERALKGVPQIEVDFSVDTNGILSVSARDKVTGTNKSITVQSVNLSEEEIKRMKSEAEMNAENDKKFKEDTENLIRAQSYLYTFDEQNRKIVEKVKDFDNNKDYKEFNDYRTKLSSLIESKDYAAIKNFLENEINKMFEVSNRLMEEVKKNDVDKGNEKSEDQGKSPDSSNDSDSNN